ncbi:outer membrane protein [Helicobacter pylori]|nr:outer membrane protein [Helicobacter pylori]
MFKNIGMISSQSNNGGSDLLVNFINDSVIRNNSAKVNTSNFQFLFNLGLRMNLATAMCLLTKCPNPLF